MNRVNGIENYPERYRKNIRTVMSAIRTDADTTMTVMLITAALMDLSPDDPKVAEIIIDDCNLYAEKTGGCGFM